MISPKCANPSTCEIHGPHCECGHPYARHGLSPVGRRDVHSKCADCDCVKVLPVSVVVVETDESRARRQAFLDAQPPIHVEELDVDHAAHLVTKAEKLAKTFLNALSPSFDTSDNRLALVRLLLEFARDERVRMADLLDARAARERASGDDMSDPQGIANWIRDGGNP